MKLNKMICNIVLTLMMAAPALAADNVDGAINDVNLGTEHNRKHPIFGNPDLAGKIGTYLNPREVIKISKVYIDAKNVWGSQYEVFNINDLVSHPKNIRDEDLLKIIKSFPNITRLDLEDCNRITDAGLEHISALPQLTYLNLKGCDNITNAGLEHIRALSQLTNLNLSYCRNITDAGLAHIRGLTQLTHLNLWGCSKITDAGLAHISALPNITYLNLSWCFNITNAGLAHISVIAQLTYLNLSWCINITDVGTAYIREALPHCKIDK